MLVNCRPPLPHELVSVVACEAAANFKASLHVVAVALLEPVILYGGQLHELGQQVYLRPEHWDAR